MDLSVPVLPAVENALLRVTVTVQGGRRQAATLALGELDPNFCKHAVLCCA